MALIRPGKSTCPVCGELIQPGDDLFATSGCALPPGDPLFDFCDAGIHWSCYEAWPDRPRFARAYVNAAVRSEPENPAWGRVHLDDNVYLCVSQQGIRLHFFSTSHAHHLRLADWLPCLRQERPTGWRDIEWRDWLRSVPVLEKLYPRSENLLAQVDWGAKNALRAAQAGERQAWEAAERQQLDAYNEQMDSFQPNPCPRCGAPGPLRYLDRRGGKTGRKSCFICPACQRSLHLPDFL